MSHPDDQWNRRYERSSKRPLTETLRWSLGVTIIVLILVAVVGLATTGSVSFGAFQAKHTAKARVTQRVYDPTNIISQVAFFHDKCNAVVKDLNVARNNAQRLKTDERLATSTDPIKQQQAAQSLANDQSDFTGALNVAQQDAADYNSRSAQYTANPFKDQGLPYCITVPSDPAALDTFSINCG